MQPKTNYNQPEFDENSLAWLKRLMAMPATRESISLGMFNLSIEGIIRVCLNQDASKPVNLDEDTLARCLKHLSEDDINPDLKSWALAVLAAALVSLEGTFRLKMVRRRRGPRAMQSSDHLENMAQKVWIAKAVEEAAARGDRSPNKVAQRATDCSEDGVKDAKAYVKRMRRLADGQG